jgi:hypothetical protein
MLYEAIWLLELDGNVFNLRLLAARSREASGAALL